MYQLLAWLWEQELAASAFYFGPKLYLTGLPAGKLVGSNCASVGTFPNPRTLLLTAKLLYPSEYHKQLTKRVQIHSHQVPKDLPQKWFWGGPNYPSSSIYGPLGNYDNGLYLLSSEYHKQLRMIAAYSRAYSLLRKNRGMPAVFSNPMAPCTILYPT